ncbi:MAG TPA: ABC transporter ATP-binding protein, partial [Anaeromyxobacteraceae bacterium]|nr:ABC transporter ATP-binding protein [Anaeromyxobacteraceae bacterium]
YDDVLAVDRLDLEVRAGECFGLLGPNGAGKTTTVEILEGLLSPDEGEVEVLGLRWGRDDAELRQRIGIQLQETQFSDKLSVREIVRLFRSFYREGRDVDEVLALVELEAKANSWYVKLSGGQKQRLAVACALVGRPHLLFLDEPTTGLDPQSRRQLWEVVHGYRSAGRTVLLTTHYMDEAERLCDRVAVVDRGRVIALGAPRELVERHAGAAVVEFLAEGGPGEAELAALPGVRAARPAAGGWALTADRVHEAVPALLALLQARRASLLRLSTHQATLDDVFVALTGRQLRE